MKKSLKIKFLQGEGVRGAEMRFNKFFVQFRKLKAANKQGSKKLIVGGQRVNRSMSIA